MKHEIQNLLKKEVYFIPFDSSDNTVDLTINLEAETVNLDFPILHEMDPDDVKSLGETLIRAAEFAKERFKPTPEAINDND